MRPRVISYAALALLLTTARGDESIVTIPGLGDVQGVLNPIAREFRALPYAAPPIGALRWKSPTPPVPWAPTTLLAAVDPPGCLQVCTQPPKGCPVVVKEDCLYLNVFTPRLTATTPPPWPVLVFAHGGNFRDGSAGSVLYNGSTYAASQNQIFVAINYRVGVQGFLHANASSDSDANAITGNYGIQDQRAALLWIRNHISAFGGDPSQVTFSGQSAGAMSVAAHLISAPSAGLFYRAVMFSEPFALPFRSPLSAYDAAAAVLDYSNCSYAKGMRGLASPGACLRSLSGDDLLAAQLAAAKDPLDDWRELLQIFMPFCPTYGTPDVPNWPLESFQGIPGSAPVSNVDIIAGTVSQEGILFIMGGFPNNVSADLYNLLLPVIFGNSAAAIAKQYPMPTPPPPDVRPLMANLTTDAMFRCSSRNATQMLQLSAGFTKRVYVYEFSHVISWAPAMWLNYSTECWNAVCHGDLPMWFMPEVAGTTNYTESEFALGSSMQSYLGNFVRTGDPGNGSVSAPVPWPALSRGNYPRMQLDTPVRLQVDPSAADCTIFNTFGYNWY